MDRRTWLAAAAAGSAACLPGIGQPTDPVRPPLEKPSAARSPRSPKLAAIKLHADWCPSCKAMGTLFEDLGRRFDADAVLFLRLDLTDQRGRLQAEYLFHVAGFAKLWPEMGEGRKTGTVLVVDVAARKIVEVIAHDTAWAQAEKIVADALKR